MSVNTSSSERFAARERVVGRRDDEDPVIRLEIYGLLVLAFSITLLLSLVSFDAVDLAAGARARAGGVANWIGPIGAHMADLFLGALGVGAFLLDAVLGALGVAYLVGRRARLTKLDVLGWLGIMLASAVLLHVMFAPGTVLDHPPGGQTGAWVGEISASLLSTPGTFILFGVMWLISLIAVTRRSVFELWAFVVTLFQRGGTLVRRGITHGDRDDADDDDDDDRGEAIGASAAAVTAPAAEAPRETHAEAPDTGDPAPAGDAAEGGSDGSEAEASAPSGASGAEGSPREDRDEGDDVVESTPASKPAPRATQSSEASSPDAADAAEDEGSFRIVESPAMRRRGELVVGEQLSLATDDDDTDAPFIPPSLSFLDYEPPSAHTYDREHLRKNAQILESKLADYRVKGKVVEIHPGPVVTMYEFKPAAGVKISAIANLENDLAMALSALRIRIVAPIPGKDVVGIEVPNKARETVWLKEVLSDPTYVKAKSKLTLSLGKDIVGNPTVMDLAKAPHLLVAGATGSGKSVAINSFIVSTLYNATPDEVRLIMVDPKMLELSIYEGIPHLLLPVVTDPKQAAVALRWAVKEMERRYRLMADMGVRNLSNYNGKVDQLRANPAQRLPEKLRIARLKREAKGEPDPEGVVLDAEGEELERLPLIVVIIDELADLMMVASKEVEHAIARLAQMARASGIHLILATQRPSVDVITGLIKANFPTRISFQVASKVDSRTILDRGGAENLLGMGDMLYLPPGTSALKRVHGSFVSEDEVHRIVAHLKDQGGPDYDLGILTHEEDDDNLPSRSGDDDYDELYDRAVRIVAETRNASISYMQRKLKIGYNRSARIVEKMEEEGIVGPSDGTSRPREVFIDPI